jgi:very-short-patch-repair endonuclease
MKQRFPKRMTSIEKMLCDQFTALGLYFEMHVSMFGRWQPDFVFAAAKVVVQADGDYWHSKPATQLRDEAFNMVARKAGWVVLRFKGSAIKKYLHLCVLTTLLSVAK